MKRIKRFLSLLLVAAMLMGVVPMSARAAEVASGTCGDNLTWVLTDDGTLTISGEGKMKDWDGIASSNPSPWHNHRSKITSVVINSGVTNIGGCAFKSCLYLTDISIPDSVTTINAGAFDGCSALTSITLPNNITAIGDDAFSDSGLTAIELPEKLKTIGSGTFQYCLALENVTIPDSVTSIGHSAFNSCIRLKSIVIPESVKTLDYYAFKGCEGLTSVEIRGALTTIGNSAFGDCVNLESASIFPGTTLLGNGMFSGCTSLTNITLPDTVTTINNTAFYECTALASVNYLGTAAQWAKIKIGTDNDPLLNAEIICEPTTHTLEHQGDLLALLASDRVNDGDTIQLLGIGNVNDINSDSAPWVIDKAVNITGGTIDLRAGGILLGADVTFDGVTLSFPNRVRNAVVANGHTLTLKNVTQDASANAVHLFCGGLTGHSVSAASGQHGTIIIQGGTSLGNVYAGSISSNGAANEFTMPATVIVDSSATGSMGVLYACGGLETLIPDNEMTNPNYVVAPPTANADAFVVSGEVTIELYQGVFKTVDGATGGAKNAVVTYNGNGNLNTLTLTDLGGLHVESGNLAPASGSMTGNVSVAPGARLDFTGFGDDLTIAAFNGGGEIVLGESQTLTITGGVSGETSVGIVEIFNGASKGPVSNNHTYIAAVNSDDSSFVLLPTQNDPNAVFVRDEDGNWTIPATEGEKIIVENADVSETVTEDAGVTYAQIPVTVSFRSDPYISYFSEVPIAITINGESLQMTYGEYGYEYASDSGLIACFVPDGDVEYLVLDGIADGEYAITMTIPADSMAGGEALTLATVLTVGEAEPEEPAEPEIIASGECGENVTWTLTDDGTLTISGTGAMGTYNAYKTPWYNYIQQITSIVIEHGVTTISDYAFYDCAAAVSVTIPDSVVTIGKSAFTNCRGLTDVTIPGSVTSLGWGAFACCLSLETVTIPGSVTSIGDDAFGDCVSLSSITVDAENENYCSADGILFSKDMTQLVIFPVRHANTEYVIPDSVTTIGNYALSGCSHLTSVTIPGGVTSIGKHAFASCYKLTSITIPTSVTSIGDYAFAYCDELTNITIPDGVTSIGDGTFASCDALTNITIPACVTSIGMSVFGDCINLKTVTYGGTEKQWNGITIGEYNDCLLNANIIFGEESTPDAPESEILASGECGELGYNLFWTLTKDGVLTISGEGEMDEFTLESTQTPDPAPWYEYASSIYSIEIGENVTSIGAWAFIGCNNVETIVVPAKVTSIGFFALNCGGLTEIVVDSENTVYASMDGVLYDKEMTDLVWYPSSKADAVYEIPVGVENISPYAFSSCVNLTAITLPESLVSIQRFAFVGCSGLTTVTIPANVTDLGNGVFTNCRNLTEILVADGNTAYISVYGVLYSADKTVLYRYPSGKVDSAFEIPSGVYAIAGYAFDWCSSLTEITIPGSINRINMSAFQNCGSLTEVIFAGTEKRWSEIVIDSGNDALLNATVMFAPAALTSGTCGESLTWMLTADGTLTISGEGAMENYTTANPAPWNVCGSSVSRIVIGDGVTSLGDRAFFSWFPVESITIPASVASIGYLALGGPCFSEFIVDPSNEVYAAEDGVLFSKDMKTLEFYPRNKADESYAIPEGVTRISNLAVSCNKALTKIYIPETVTNIGAMAFCDCTGLTSVTIPASVAGVGGGMFLRCTSLSQILVAEGNQNFVSRDGVLYYSDMSSLVQYPAGKSGKAYEIPCGVNTVFALAFGGCNELTSVTIPDSITVIGQGAFSECTGLANVVFAGSVEQWNAVTVYDNNEPLLNAEIVCAGAEIIEKGTCGENLTWALDADGVLTISGTGEMTDYDFMTAPWYDYCADVTAVVIDDGVTSIGKCAFYNCTNLVCAEIPATVSKIADAVFYDCTGLENIIVSGDNAAFTDVDGVLFDKEMTRLIVCPANNERTTYTIPTGVFSLGNDAFSHCEKLVEIIIPSSVQAVGYYTFRGCTALEEITLPERVFIVGDGVFVNCSNLTAIHVADSNKYYNSRDGVLFSEDGTKLIAYPIGKEADTYTVPAEVTKICDGAFAGSENLISVELPEGINTIAKKLFENCVNLVSIAIPEGVISIGESAFSGCDALTEPELPDGLTEIGVYVFYKSGLTAIHIPGSVAKIGEAAFAGCNKLATVYYDGDAKQWGNIEIGAYNSKLTSANVIFGVVELDIPVITVTLNDSDQPVLTWPAVDGAEKYEVWRAVGNGEFKLLKTMTGRKLTNTSVEVGKTYSYKVRAMAGDTYSEYSAVKTITVPAEVVLEAPTLSVGNKASTGKVVLSWSKIDGAEKYEIWSSTSKNGTYKRLWTGSGTSVNHNSATEGVTYYYKVRALAGGVYSEFSAIKLRACDLAQPVVTVSNNASTGKVVISWKAVSGAAKYEVYRSTSKDGTYTKLWTGTGTKLTHSSAEAGVTYYYKVCALHAANTSATSAYSEIKSRACDLAQPVVTVSNNASTGKVVLSWEKIEGAAKYEVYRSTSKDGTYTKLWTGTGTKLTHTSAEAGVTYYYKVRAIHSTNSSATSAYSEIKSRTCDCARPSVTITLNGSGKPVLSWGKVEGAVKYEVYRSTSKDGTYTKLWTGTGTKLTNTSAKAGVTYYYKVKAICSVSSGNSAYSVVKSVTIG